MEDAISHSSLDSSSTGDEFVLVHADPKFKITGDMDDIKKEILKESQSETILQLVEYDDKMAENVSGPTHVIQSSQSDNVLNVNNSGDSDQAVGSMSLPATPGGDYIVFNGVTYLGCATVNAPRSEVEIYRNMAILNEQSKMAIPIVLSVPSTADGIVRLLDPENDTEIAEYKVHRILFCARGPSDSNERRCFAFTCSHGDSADSTLFQCHVFRCDLPEAVPKILYCFANTFRRVPRSMTSSTISTTEAEEGFVFTVNLDFKEEDGKGGFTSCPCDKNVFKFRCGNERRIVISVQQNGPKELRIERCFGLLIAPGRNVKHGDMHLIEMTAMGYTDGKNYTVSGHWDPTEECFSVLNTETPKEMRVFLTVAIDLVIYGIQEPVRFAVETKAKIFPQNEKFWYLTRKPHVEQFHVKLQQVEDPISDNGGIKYEVASVESQTEIDRKKAGMSLGFLHNRHVPPEEIQTPQDPEEESDGDEPLLSGSGVVSKEITDENLLDAWRDVLKKWHQNLAQRPKQVHHLARKGIPEALRGEVWQLLAGVQDNLELLEAYRVLITKDSPCEGVIMRDINRTFPAHNFFKDTGGLGQDSLYKISKAYSVYDEEVGYCQGLSFLAAALLLHMPEEQAFSVLVKIMFDYELRNLFRNDFEELHLKFYQLERLLQDQLSDIYGHFMDMNLETHMYASQWFLTLFTAKFPLHLVFHILDIFLSEGKDIIFSVALSLLKLSRKDILALDFEGVLKYFRVQLPKRFRSEEAARELLQTVISTKVTLKKLKKYQKEYDAMKEQEIQQEDPVERLQRENKRLMEANLRLEAENDDLAHEMVESKLMLRNELDKAQETSEALTGELIVTKKIHIETEEEKKRLETEAHQLKEMCRRELDRVETENERNKIIIADYKQICSQLSERLEKQQTLSREELQSIRNKVKSCDNCSKLFDVDGKVKLLELKVNPESLNPRISDLERHVREVELELAQTKLALVESECKTQDLTHQLNAALTEIQASKNTWFTKTINSLREVANNPRKESKENKE
ncbi:hypothetical protein ACJMK2_040008 [Sinanodonta woodiana]|uniref:Rab GTPase-activating protein 1 n=1 Tax=Sinanodonta woodiana TaxID=1069815 RepID=A0ABD3WEM9_SINWO